MVDILRASGPQGSSRNIQASVEGAVHTKEAQWRFLSEEQVTSSDGTANSLTRPGAAQLALIHVTAADIYFTLNPALTPASGVGDDATSGDDIELEGAAEIANFRAVRQSSANFTLKVSYFKEEAYDIE